MNRRPGIKMPKACPLAKGTSGFWLASPRRLSRCGPASILAASGAPVNSVEREVWEGGGGERAGRGTIEDAKGETN